jgi:surfeit locus 1 family protein
MQQARKRDWFLFILLLVLVPICLRLGIWQLSRLRERRAHNAYVQARLAMPVLPLPTAIPEPGEWEYRIVVVSGRFDHEHEIVLRNRAFNEQPGVHVLTPLILAGGGSALLVDRGWVPIELEEASAREALRVEGEIKIKGIVRLSQPEPSWSVLADPTPAPGGPPLLAWRVVNLERIQRQMPYPLLPVFIELSEPLPGAGTLPRPQPEIDLSQGPHLSYAIQWFSFAAIAAGGAYLWWQRRLRPAGPGTAE